MFVLFKKQPVALHSEKSGYVMTWRGKQLALCESRGPLESWISEQGPRADNYYIEEYPVFSTEEVN